MSPNPKITRLGSGHGFKGFSALQGTVAMETLNMDPMIGYHRVLKVMGSDITNSLIQVEKSDI